MPTTVEAPPAVASHFRPEAPGEGMSLQHALMAFHALSQATRLQIFRLLMAREPEGLAAGLIAEQVEGPHNTVSQHLSILARAGLIWGDRQGRSIIYHAHTGTMGALMSFVLMDCCHGHPEACAPVIAALTGQCDCEFPYDIQSTPAPAKRPVRKPRRNRRD